MVRVNHFCNCLLCHSPSLNVNDYVRGRIPLPGEPPPPAYYDSPNPIGLFARADVTFLRQDFSVVQTVAHPGNWVADQRFDFIIRQRRVGAEEREIELASSKDRGGEIGGESYHRRAARFALDALRTPVDDVKALPAPLPGALGPN